MGLFSDPDWRLYTAIDDIYIDGVLAFLAGSQVPISHVRRGVVSRDDVFLRFNFDDRITPVWGTPDDSLLSKEGMPEPPVIRVITKDE